MRTPAPAGERFVADRRTPHRCCANPLASSGAPDSDSAAERLDAIEAGLCHNAVYMRELEQDLTAARASYVGLAVTEMATPRGQLGGPQLG